MTTQEQNIKLRAHCNDLAEALANMAGYMRAMNTDRQMERCGETYALQTLEYAEGAAEYCDRADVLLTAHDELSDELHALANDKITQPGQSAPLAGHGSDRA